MFAIPRQLPEHSAPQITNSASLELSNAIDSHHNNPMGFSLAGNRIDRAKDNIHRVFVDGENDHVHDWSSGRVLAFVVNLHAFAQRVDAMRGEDNGEEPEEEGESALQADSSSTSGLTIAD